MRYQQRLYRCSTCGGDYLTGTNHIGSHWGRCALCGSHSMKSCREPEALEAVDRLPFSYAHIYYYRFDIGEPAQRAAYKALCKVLKDRGSVKFDSISPDHSDLYKKAIKPRDGMLTRVLLNWVTDNQWNTADGLRVFDWSEAIYPNKDIKEGAYLEITPEMTEARANWQKD